VRDVRYERWSRMSQMARMARMNVGVPEAFLYARRPAAAGATAASLMFLNCNIEPLHMVLFRRLDMFTTRLPVYCLKLLYFSLVALCQPEQCNAL
jgi:hypothetical protein